MSILNMGIQEFKDYLESIDIKTVYYNTINQSSKDANNTYFKLDIAFNSIVAYPKSRLICMAGECGKAYITKVKSIIVKEDDFGTILTIICGDIGCDHFDKTHIFLAS